MPIAAEAMIQSWLPREALEKLVASAASRLAEQPSLWVLVKGPAAVFVASAWRLCWEVLKWPTLRNDVGQPIDLTRDSPAMVQRFVQQSVWLEVALRRGSSPTSHTRFGWTWHIHATCFHLLNEKDSYCWGPVEKVASRSAFANRQWPQARLHQAGFTSSSNCSMCGSGAARP